MDWIFKDVVDAEQKVYLSLSIDKIPLHTALKIVNAVQEINPRGRLRTNVHFDDPIGDDD